MANRRSTDVYIVCGLVVLALGAVVVALAFPGTRAGDQIGDFIARTLGPDDFSHAQRVPVCAGGAVLCVIDGDTLRYGEDRLRLQNIDAPEIFEPGCDAERQLGLASRDRLAELLSAQAFRVLYDGTDRFGRRLVELRNEDGSLGAQLVDEGLAHWFEDRLTWC
ncbi:MAG: thermonuclease family protein [Devosiaceae bacterium]